MCTLALVQEELRIKHLRTSSIQVGVITDLYCYKVLADALAIEGGGTQLSPGVKRFDGRCGSSRQEVVHMG